jgi:HK97 gp10 family phage protein
LSNLNWHIDTRELDRIAANSDKTAEQILRRLAFEVEADAKQMAPIDTGALRNSIYTVTEKSDGYGDASGKAMGSAWKKAGQIRETEPHPAPGKGEARVGPCVNYAEYQEFGTSKMPAHPYLIPALEKVRGKFEEGTTFKELCE